MREILFDLKFERAKTGLWHVYTEGTSRTLYLSHRDIEAIIKDLPDVLRKTLVPESQRS